MVLTSIPFAIKYIAIPMGEKDKKWKNLFNLVGSESHIIKRCFCSIIKVLHNWIRKMQVSKKHRQLYVFILILILVSVQIVNNKASIEAADMIKSAASYENFSKIRGEYLTLFYNRFVVLLGLGWFVQQPITNLIVLIATLALFNKKIANKWLEILAYNKKMQFGFMLIMLASLFTPTSDGFLISQVMFVFMLFAIFYPKFDNVKSRRYFAFKQLKKYYSQA